MAEQLFFVKIALLDRGSYVEPLATLENFVEEVRSAADEEGLDYKWTLELVQMTQEEFDALEEFTGY